MTQRKAGSGAGVLAVIAVGLVAACGEDRAAPPAPRFENQTESFGLARSVSTFSAGVSDFNGDGQDDLLIGNHGFPPALYLKDGDKFTDVGALLPDGLKGRADRHGFTLVDIDNDGDTDILHAAGGADGVGRGSANAVYQNMLTEQGTLQFGAAQLPPAVAKRAMRARHFIPIASPSGEKVDFYLTSLHKKRKGSTNLYITNSSKPGAIRLEVNDQSDLNRPFESNGKDLMFDFDRDGLTDLLQMGFDHVKLFRNTGSHYQYTPSPLDGMTMQYNLPAFLQRGTARFKSAVTADFNNDGYPDLYLGSSNLRAFWQSHSDRVSYEGNELHFSVENQSREAADSQEIQFRTTAPEIGIDFKFHQPNKGEGKKDPADIYIGAAGTNPDGRTTTISVGQAAGKPADMSGFGTYIWHEPGTETWHILWRHPPGKRTRQKGIVRAQDISDVTEVNFQSMEERKTADVLLLNDRGRNWIEVELPILEHTSMTTHLTAADVNNDGWMDVIGTRTGGVAEENGTPFLLLNHGSMEFSAHQLPGNPATRIFRADIIVHGFFDEDRLPDIFYTNGYGLLPSFMGPYQLLINRTDTPYDAVVLELEGVEANRDAIGAQVELYDRDDRLLGYRELGANFGLGQDTGKLHFGLGNAPGPYRAKLAWPGAADSQELTLTEGGNYKVVQGKPPVKR